MKFLISILIAGVLVMTGGCKKAMDSNGTVTCPLVATYPHFESGQGAYVFPTAFTPDDDGLNDTYSGLGSPAVFEEFSYRITDKYGNVVFQSSDAAASWDGKYNGVTGSGAYSLDYEVRVKSVYPSNQTMSGHICIHLLKKTNRNCIAENESDFYLADQFDPYDLSVHKSAENFCW